MLGLDVPAGWATEPVYRGGELAGFFMVQGNEIHAYRAPEYSGRWLTRQDLERLTAPLFEKHGRVVTKVRSANDTGHRFVTRLGFTKTHEADGLTYYEATRIQHARH